MNWMGLRDYLIDLLKRATVKAALKKLVLVGGIKAWLVTFLVEECFEEVAEPVVKYFFRKIGYAYNRAKGEVTLKKLEQSYEEGDHDTYVDTLSSV